MLVVPAKGLRALGSPIGGAILAAAVGLMLGWCLDAPEA